MFYLTNEITGMFAHVNSTGEHDGRVTDNLHAAKSFETRAEAAEYSQNFGPDWTVWEI